MSTRFNDLMRPLLAKEGGYSNDPVDRGGETIFGITAATARAAGYSGAMRAMTRDQAVAIYEQRYWKGPGFDLIDAVFPDLAERLFDIGVNCGPGTGAKFLQRALNVLNGGGSLWPDLKVDGDAGPATRQALQAFLNQRGPMGRATLLGMIRAQHSVYYIELAERTPSQERFEYGWQAQRAIGVLA